MSVAMNIKIPGLAKLQAAAKKSPLIVAKRVQTAIKKSVVSIIRSTVPLTPHKTGHLQQAIGGGAGTLNTIGKMSAIVGSDLEYAVPQHEHTDWNHPLGGQAKFLEAGVTGAEKEIQEHFKEALDDSMADIAKG
jgi:hypothetical protein